MAPNPERRYHPEPSHDDDDDDDELYDENADEDFNPETAAPGPDGDDDVSSASDSADDEDGDDRAHAPRRKTANAKKRKSGAVDAVDDAGLDSGDEATIKERKRRRKREDEDEDDDGDESGGEGGLVKTRAQRAAETAERRQIRRVAAAGGRGDVTIDVDAVWADLSARGVGRRAEETEEGGDTAGAGGGAAAEKIGKEKNGRAGEATTAAGALDDEEMITITRTIEYAGEVTQVEERVARSSKQGREWLKTHPVAASGAAASDKADPDAASTLLRPLRRPSAFEPNPAAVVKGVAPEKLRPRAPSRLDVLAAAQRAAAEAKKKAEKMTTVQKSALDWQGFVAKEAGLKEELEGYGKSKHGFLAREAFLDRAAGAREERGREARLLG